jgi:S-adenosylmethionine decarboxylase
MDIGTHIGLNDAEYIKQTITEIIETIGMRPLSEIMTFTGAADAGVTGIVVIETSHIAFHGFSDERMLYIDVFSCVPFASSDVIAIIQKRFQPFNINVHLVDRYFPFTSRKLKQKGFSNPIKKEDPMPMEI